jgi:hypothetical protein
VLGVSGDRADRAAGVLERRCGAATFDVTRILLDAMRAEAGRVGLPWEAVLAADAAEAGSRERQGLAALVERAVPHVDRAVEAAFTDAGQGGRPVLLTELAPLARYGHLGTLARWSDLSAPRGQAVWVLLPQLAGLHGAIVDGTPLPLSAPGQFLRLDSAWVAAG